MSTPSVQIDNPLAQDLHLYCRSAETGLMRCQIEWVVEQEIKHEVHDHLDRASTGLRHGI